MKYFYGLFSSLFLLLILIVIGVGNMPDSAVPTRSNPGLVNAQAQQPSATFTPFLPAYPTGTATSTTQPSITAPIAEPPTLTPAELQATVTPTTQPSTPAPATEQPTAAVISPTTTSTLPSEIIHETILPAEQFKERPLIPVLVPDQLSPNNDKMELPLESATPFLPSIPTSTPTATPQPTATPTPTLAPEQWKEWPVMPAGVSERLKEVYRQGLENGNNPAAFSILGDCQSQPEVFLGVYDRDPDFVGTLSSHLRETVTQFSGSFNRYSPTVKDGTTEGALLWPLWNENREGKCNPNESPLDCELRVHQPVIAFIHIGTHWEARNEHYLTIIIDTLLANGTVPVLVTKADNREFDERINRTLVKLAAQYDLPLWNFWASVQHLPNHGLRYGQNMYLSAEGVEIHRVAALDVLDFVWRELE